MQVCVPMGRQHDTHGAYLCIGAIGGFHGIPEVVGSQWGGAPSVSVPHNDSCPAPQPLRSIVGLCASMLDQ